MPRKGAARAPLLVARRDTCERRTPTIAAAGSAHIQRAAGRPARITRFWFHEGAAPSRAPKGGVDAAALGAEQQ
jgi:hypothetical protein